MPVVESDVSRQAFADLACPANWFSRSHILGDLELANGLAWKDNTTRTSKYKPAHIASALFASGCRDPRRVLQTIVRTSASCTIDSLLVRQSVS